MKRFTGFEGGRGGVRKGGSDGQRETKRDALRGGGKRRREEKIYKMKDKII